MDDSKLLKYYENKINNIDVDIKNGIKIKKYISKKLNRQISTHSFLNKLSNRFFQTMLVLSITTVAYISYGDILQTASISVGILLIVNLIKFILLYLSKPDGLKYNRIIEYENYIDDLKLKRAIYVNLYKYILNGENVIIDNIKLKINQQEFFEYDKYIEEEWISSDNDTLNILLEMKKKENIITESIKNKVYWELNGDYKTEELTNEQLKLIQSAL